jgi:ornithine--oxo-acid transaminase
VSQVEKIAVCSRAFHSEELCLFSEELARVTGMDMVLPMNSGAEAVETALKIARKWGYEKKGIPAGKAKIIALAGNFHGRTVTIVSFSSEPNYRDGFGPFTPGFSVVPFGDSEALESAVDENTVGILIEPIQAEAGILVPPPGYLGCVKRLCEKNRILMIADEIQTGLGRTGRNFCYEHENARPDLLILGKSLGGGLLPISATVGRRDVMEVIEPGQHGSTFGGNPLACAVARSALRLLIEERLAERAAHLGRIAMEELNRVPLPHVKEIRGRGFLIGIELEPSSGGARQYCEQLAELGVLCKETHTYVIRIAPPLVIGEEDLRRGLEKITSVIRKRG